MNIKEIAEQSGFQFYDAGFAPIEHTVPLEYSEKLFNKFAELIIQECAGVVR